MRILDSSIIILFLNEIEGGDYLSMLSKSDEELVIPESVYKEILDESTKSKLDFLITNGVLKKLEKLNYRDKKIIEDRFLVKLGKGELNVLAWGKKLQREQKNFHCVIDEIVGRDAAEKLGLPLTGSIGLIKVLIEKKVLKRDKIKTIIEEIKKSAFWINEEILEGLLNE
jgi:predicted nucleic acid-binding protein